MTFYETTRPKSLKVEIPIGVRSRLTAFIHAVQYGQMLQAMHQLSDAQLDQIGIARKDIPAHAHRCIYEESTGNQ